MTAPSGLIIVDKPGGMTSHDVVARIRRIAGTRRVGHAGTLDPMATGILVVGVEKATRLLGYLTLAEKTYAATIRLGRSTSTDDAEGEPTGGSPATGVSAAALRSAIEKLTGEIVQVPPGVSAIKVGGQRAYKLTRAGAAPDLAARPVTVYEFTVIGMRTAGDFLDLDAVIRCSSGTYVRALARDLGVALGTGGHLTALRRTAVGPYDLSQARTLEDLSERPRVIPLAEAAAAAFPRVDLSADDARRLAHGARVPAPAHGARVPAPAHDAQVLAPAHGDRVSAPAQGDQVPAPAHDPRVPAPAHAAGTAETPMAAFAPDDTLVALVTEDSGSLRALAVFAAPVPAKPTTYRN
jgi:tRNA pseudouridine55 synthase